jgi:hypothetical protein
MICSNTLNSIIESSPWRNYLHDIYMQLEFFMDRIKNFKEKALRHCVHNEDYMNSIHDKNHPMYKDNLNKIKHGFTNGKPNWVEEE